MAKLGQIKSGTMRVGNTTASGYGIVYADEVIGHRRVNTYAELKTLPEWCLYNKAGGDNINTAIGQLWYVYNGDPSHVAGLYQLVGTDISLDASWKLFKNGADVSTHDTTYTFANGLNGTFTVTPKGGSAQTVSIGKPDTAKNADSAKNADNATNATNAVNATKATQDKNGRDIVDTYLTKTSASNKYALKSDVSALSSALVYKGTIGTGGTITKLNVAAKVGDVYVAVEGAPVVNSVALEAGDMIIAKTEGDGTNTLPTWTAIQTNINGAVTTNNTELATDKLIIADGSKRIRTASGTGLVKVENGTVSWDTNKYLTSHSLPAAADGKLGCIALGYSQTGKNYAVELDDDNKAYVNVPWTDNNSQYTADGVYVTLDKGQFSLHRDKKTLIDNAIQPSNIETEDGILTYDRFGYLYHLIKTVYSDKYVCEDLVKSYVSVKIIQHSEPVSGGTGVRGALVFCANAPLVLGDTCTGKFGQYRSTTDLTVFGTDVTWALDNATDLIVVDLNGNEYTVTSEADSTTLKPRAIQKSTITSLFN